MIYFSDLGFTNDFECAHPTIYADSPGHWYNEKVSQPVLMQFTSLLDKNGKEIYEGDILKDDVGDLYEVRFGELPLDKSGGCVCTYPAFYAHYEKTVDGRTGFNHECSQIGNWMEVIGNIHESKI